MEDVTTQAPAALDGGAAPLPRLITVQVSHFCEKARWVLDRAGIAYVEEPHLQGPNVIAALRAGGSRRVPVLVAPDGAVLPSSDAIARWCDAQLGEPDRLIPGGPFGEQARALEDDLGQRLGPAARTWAYGAIRPLHADYDEAWVGRLPSAEQAALRLGRHAVDRAVRLRFRVSRAGVTRAWQEIEAVFDDVGGLLKRSGGKHLLGDRLTIADITFAALAAPVLVPPQTAGTLPALEAMPEPVQTSVERLREHPAGAYAMELWTRR